MEFCEEPTAGGRGTRKGAVKKHSQRQTKLMEQNCWTKRSCSSGEFLSQKKPGRTAANLLTRNVAKRPLRGCQACISPTIIPDERRIAFHFVPLKTELVARATDEQAALAEVIARHRDAAASAEAADCATYNVRGVIVPRNQETIATSGEFTGRSIGAFLNAILKLKRCTPAIS